MPRDRFKTVWWWTSLAIIVLGGILFLPRDNHNNAGDPDGEAFYAMSLVAGLCLLAALAAVIGYLVATLFEGDAGPSEEDEDEHR